MFFNVPEVRKFLLENGFVCTLRKKRKRVGNDTAVYGNYYNKTSFAKIFIEEIREIDYFPQLLMYVEYSGLVEKVPACREIDYETRERIRYNDAKEWFELAQKLSGKELWLYKITVVEKLK